MLPGNRLGLFLQCRELCGDRLLPSTRLLKAGVQVGHMLLHSAGLRLQCLQLPDCFVALSLARGKLLIHLLQGSEVAFQQRPDAGSCPGADLGLGLQGVESDAVL